jgi:hypothetical protein
MRRILALALLACASLPLHSPASPGDQARARAMATFAQKDGARIVVDPLRIEAEWEKAPFDPLPYTYSFDEIRDRWPQLMRSLKIPYPSPEYLRERYTRFPDMMHDLGYQDADWEMHSLNVLEVWQAFFRGDFRKARDLGIRYGGYAQIPGVFAQLMQALYLTRSEQVKQMLLQDAIDRIQAYAQSAPFLPGETEFHQDYVIFRLGFAYAVGRLAEDVPVPVMLANGYAPMVINAANEAMAVDPDHALTLALNAAFDANVIRRVGKTAGRVTFNAQPINAGDIFARAVELAGDMAIVRYEYANSLLYMEQTRETEEAIRQLEAAAAAEPSYSMEVLDQLYARKRLEEVRALQKSGMGFRAFDRARRRHMERSGENLYCVLLPPFSP